LTDYQQRRRELSHRCLWAKALARRASVELVDRGNVLTHVLDIDWAARLTVLVPEQRRS